MLEWLEGLRRRINSTDRPISRGRFHRRIQLSGAAVAWLRAPERTGEERLAFAELLLKLDADPARHSEAVLRAGAPAGLRWAPFGTGRAVFIWDYTRDQISVLSCA